MKQIGQCFKGNYKEIVLGPIFKLLEAAAELMVPLVMAGLIDQGVRNGDTAYVVQRGLLMLLLAAAGAAAGITCQYYAAAAAGQFGRRLRRLVFGRVMGFSETETQRFGAGGLITRLTNDTAQIQNGLNMFVRLATRVPFLAVGSIAMAIWLNPRAGLVFLGATLLISAVLFLIMKFTLPGYLAIQKNQDELSRLGAENLDGVRVIRAFSRQKEEEARFGKKAHQLVDWMVKVGRVSAMLNPLTSFIANMAIVVLVWVGAKYVFAGAMATGQVIALVSYMSQTLLALLVAATLIVVFTKAIASAKRIEEILEIQPLIQDGPGVEGQENKPLVEFERVSFRYHAEGENALDTISFQVRKGEILGIIGGTGSGKTTLASLLVRYYDPSKGNVMIRGENAKEYTLKQLRGKMGLVPQNATLFSGTILENLRISAPQASEQECWEALETAQAAEFVKQMPQQLDTVLEEGGSNLSGGQRQRLTIARALVRKPEILILDDAASALDYATDAALRRALAQWQQRQAGMTIIMISQRAASLKNSDYILVLEEGELAGEGEHEQLLADSRVYREICESQGIGA